MFDIGHPRWAHVDVDDAVSIETHERRHRARDDTIAIRSSRRRVDDEDARDEDARVHVTVPRDLFAQMSAFGDARARADARERYR